MWALVVAASVPLPEYSSEAYAVQEADTRILQVGKAVDAQLDRIAARLQPSLLQIGEGPDLLDLHKHIEEQLARAKKVQAALRDGDLRFPSSLLETALSPGELRLQHGRERTEMEKAKVERDEAGVADTEAELDAALRLRPHARVSAPSEAAEEEPGSAFSLLQVGAPLNVEAEKRELRALARKFQHELDAVQIEPASLLQGPGLEVAHEVEGEGASHARAHRAVLDAKQRFDEDLAARSRALKAALARMQPGRLDARPASFVQLGGDFELEESERAAAAGEQQMRTIQGTLSREQARLQQGLEQMSEEHRAEREAALQASSPHAWAGMKLEDSLRKE